MYTPRASSIAFFHLIGLTLVCGSLVACSEAPANATGGAGGGETVPPVDDGGSGGAASGPSPGSGGSALTTGGTSGDGGTDSSNGGGSTGGVPGVARDTMYVSGREVKDRCGESVVLKGPNHMAIYGDRAGDAIAEIAKTGANAVRIMWFATHGVPIDEAEALVSKTIDNGMVPILEMHDATGPDNWGNMADIVEYWTTTEAVAFIDRHEASFILNIANEAGPNAGQGYDEFESVYEAAIDQIRDASIRVPLMIDASGWGRDQGVLFEKGQALLEHDPLHNVIFSWHAYDPLNETELTEVLEQAVELELPFVIGEFANRSPVGTCGPDIQYKHLIAEANRLSLGWLPWSWGLNPADSYANGDCWEFDMTTTLAFDSLERWGEEVAVTDPNSLANTAERTFFLENGTCP